jgi:hypothetical protein
VPRSPETCPNKNSSFCFGPGNVHWAGIDGNNRVLHVGDGACSDDESSQHFLRKSVKAGCHKDTFDGALEDHTVNDA